MDVELYTSVGKWVIDASSSKIMILLSGWDRGDTKVYTEVQLKSDLILSLFQL